MSDYIYKKMSLADIDLLTQIRIEVLRAANKLSPQEDMGEVQRETADYYRKSLADDSHAAYLVFDKEQVIGSGGVSFYRVMPTFRNPSGQKAYIMNMYTHPQYRRKGIAAGMLDHLVMEAEKKGITFITLEATESGRPLYERYGFRQMLSEMEL